MWLMWLRGYVAGPEGIRRGSPSKRFTGSLTNRQQCQISGIFGCWVLKETAKTKQFWLKISQIQESSGGNIEIEKSCGWDVKPRTSPGGNSGDYQLVCFHSSISYRSWRRSDFSNLGPFPASMFSTCSDFMMLSFPKRKSRKSRKILCFFNIE